MSSSEEPADKPITEAASTTNDVVDKKPSKPTKEAKKPTAKNRSVTLFLVIIVLFGVVATSLYLVFETNKKLETLQSAQALQTSDTANVFSKYEEIQASLSQLGAILEQYKKTGIAHKDKIQSLQLAQQTLQQTTKNVFDITHRNQRLWILSEVSYLLSLANQRLIVSRDTRTAIVALKSANSRLHDLADPSLLHLRKKIAEETSQLSLLKLPDINGIALSLDNMTAGLEQLPFKTAQQKHIESTQRSEKVKISSLEDAGLLSPLWERVKSLVTIKKHHRNIQETKTPVQKSNIDNQLRYRLETSRLALINKNTSVFQNEIKNALGLLTTYYDKNDNRVATLSTDLTNFSTTNLLPSLPDITGSWTILQKIIAVNNASDTLKVKKGKSIQ